MDKIIRDTSFDEERALYASQNLILINVAFDGEADGESAVKECKNITAENCYFNLRYPLWHVDGLKISGCTMTGNCRAALWYSSDISIENTALGGIKAVRECRGVKLDNCNIVSAEFGWFTDDISLESCGVTSEYFLLKSVNISLKNVNFNGKYSFQYVVGGTIEGCTLTTKDAFWHAKGLHIKNCRVIGEYLGWYSEDLVFENCEIVGTQPLCYCKNLRLINCSMSGCDLAFEKSEVYATVTTRIDSVKNPCSGQIYAPEVGEIIRDDPLSEGKIVISADKQ